MPFCTSFIDAKVLSCRRQEVFKTYELWDSLNDYINLLSLNSGLLSKFSLYTFSKTAITIFPSNNGEVENVH